MKNLYRLSSIFMIIAVILTFLSPMQICADARISGFACGSGTENDPYLIENKEHLNNVRNALDAHYKMVADITFTDSDFAIDGDFYNNGKGWEPIGEFLGTLDGDGHSVSNLFFDIDKSRNYAGLFSTNAGTIKNLSVENVEFNAEATCSYIARNATISVGVIAGQSSGTISNCYSSGVVKAIATWGGNQYFLCIIYR